MKAGWSWRPLLHWSLGFILALAASLSLHASPAAAAPSLASAQPQPDRKQVLEQRKDLFDKTSMVTGVPWYYLAAIDQYERTLNAARKRTNRQGLIGIYFADTDWAGLLNPDREDTNPQSIAVFRGFGRDGSGDGVADRNNDLDLLAAMTYTLTRHGRTEDDLRIGLWNYYQNSRSVERITQFARIYQAYGTLDLHEHAFPLPVKADYSYRSTWGASRAWGGARVHEGTDLFASHGVPVRSSCYGIIEVMGWNPYGGWRVGIRDLDNMYHYYAHLSGFNKKVKEGDLVKPGQVIGWVGSSGYGKPGTSGKFPPHLHYGLYRDNGLSDWSFDPYPSLRRWEREDRRRSK